MRSPRLRWLFIGANATVLALPLLALSFLRIYDVYLLRVTERQLLAESVVIGEAFRDAWLRESGLRDDEHRPPGHAHEAYVPVEPVFDLGTTSDTDEAHRLPLTPAAPVRGALPDAPLATPEARAGAAIEPLLRRAQTFNLSGIRVLDARGCVIATTRSERGACMADLPEVGRALGGRYAAVARERISDEPAPPLGDIRRRGGVRMFTALPVFSNGKVIAVVRASRTGLDAVSSLWAYRRGLVWTAIAIAVLTMLVSLAFSTAIAWPLRRLTRAAAAIAEGKPAPPLDAKGFSPAEIRTLGEMLETMRRKLEARASYVAEFASNASHELKTPITAIRGAAELLQHDLDAMDAAQRARFVDNIAADAARMERLVTRMLQLARADNPVTEGVRDIDVHAFCAAFLSRHGDAVQLSQHNPPATIAIQEDLLASALGNLVDNALRYGAGNPVQVVLGREAHRLRIDVIDRGPGISRPNRRHLFERFFTTERDRGGTGLGLAIVKAIAEARGGRIEANSGSGTTTFTVTL
jgi:signal transduction histidine kinase